MEAKDEYKLYMRLMLNSNRAGEHIKLTCYYQKALALKAKSKLRDLELFNIRMAIDSYILQTLN